jgi:hypothetical protein
MPSQPSPQGLRPHHVGDRGGVGGTRDSGGCVEASAQAQPVIKMANPIQEIGREE